MNMNLQKESIIYPLPTIELIQQKERAWHLNLPEDYKSFIMENNGGVPYKGIFCHKKEERLITRFLCMLAKPKENLLGWYDIDVVESQIGERLTDDLDLVGVDVLPIAEVFGGDYICLDYRLDKLNPTVSLWNHELSGESAPYTEKVCRTFTEFLKMFHENEGLQN